MNSTYLLVLLAAFLALSHAMSRFYLDIKNMETIARSIPCVSISILDTMISSRISYLQRNGLNSLSYMHQLFHRLRASPSTNAELMQLLYDVQIVCIHVDIGAWGTLGEINCYAKHRRPGSKSCISVSERKNKHCNSTGWHWVKLSQTNCIGSFLIRAHII